MEALKFRIRGRLVPNRPDPPLPSAAKMAMNFTRAVIQEGAARVRGVPAVDELEQARRKAICDRCPQLRSDGRCSLCGCWRDKKAAWRSQRCPIGNWTRVDGQQKANG